MHHADPSGVNQSHRVDMHDSGMQSWRVTRQDCSHVDKGHTALMHYAALICLVFGGQVLYEEELEAGIRQVTCSCRG